MAHFAEINENNEVVQVVVVDNELITDENGVEQESLGVEFLNNFYNGKFTGADGVERDVGTWVQTSYNNNLRKQYAGMSFTYDSDKDIFIEPQPFPSWSLDSNSDWQAPIPYPSDGKYYSWNEDETKWVEMTY